MNRTQPLIHCPNSACAQLSYPLERKFCESCQTPLVNRYLWAAARAAEQIPVGERVAERYHVMAPQIWLDTRPDLPPHNREPLPATIIPYLRLYPQSLHVPEVHGIVPSPLTQSEILLLENVPVDATGNLLPSIKTAWERASSVRQVYWLWQILQLWKPLAEYRVVSSLFVPENIRVEGWRVRLRQLYPDALGDTDRSLSTNNLDAPAYATSETLESGHHAKSVATPTLVKPLAQPSLQQLGECWASWFDRAQPQVNIQLQEIYQQLQKEDASYSAIARQLNQLLLEQSALMPWQCQVAGATDSGPSRQQNEDSYYPTNGVEPTDLIPNLSIICDGIGGHEGGAVASQLAVQCLKLQINALLAEVAKDTEILMPDMVKEQLAAIIRVANNLIAAQNDAQNRESRRRMGTTLAMALHLPQQVKTHSGTGTAREVYIAHVGDSRAYWITPHYCQQLTVDDDVATREVRTGRSLYWQALTRADAGALTQALGTRDGDLLRPTVQRFIVEEDGVLLLCSDGLSDNNLIEQYWAEVASPLFSGQMSAESAAQCLINLANQKNGHDNTSVVLSYYRVSEEGSSEHPAVLELGETPPNTSAALEFNPQSLPVAAENAVESAESQTPGAPLEPQVTTNTIAPAEPNTPPQEPQEQQPPQATTRSPKTSGLLVILGVLGLLSVGSIVGLMVWFLLNPDAAQMLRDRAPSSEQSPVTPQIPQSSPVPSQKQNNR